MNTYDRRNLMDCRNFTSQVTLTHNSPDGWVIRPHLSFFNFLESRKKWTTNKTNYKVLPRQILIDKIFWLECWFLLFFCLYTQRFGSIFILFFLQSVLGFCLGVWVCEYFGDGGGGDGGIWWLNILLCPARLFCLAAGCRYGGGSV